MQKLIAFPPELEAAISEESKSFPASKLMSSAAGLSEHYRESLSAGKKPAVRGHLAAVSYATIIMPATYAQLAGAIQAVIQRIPAWKPSSVLDIGSGPGNWRRS